MCSVDKLFCVGVVVRVFGQKFSCKVSFLLCKMCSADCFDCFAWVVFVCAKAPPIIGRVKGETGPSLSRASREVNINVFHGPSFLAKRLISRFFMDPPFLQGG